jgi:hypothetical protein
MFRMEVLYFRKSAALTGLTVAARGDPGLRPRCGLRPGLSRAAPSALPGPMGARANQPRLQRSAVARPKVAANVLPGGRNYRGFARCLRQTRIAAALRVAWAASPELPRLRLSPGRPAPNCRASPVAWAASPEGAARDSPGWRGPRQRAPKPWVRAGRRSSPVRATLRSAAVRCRG